jgi:hypothetical protein
VHNSIIRVQDLNVRVQECVESEQLVPRRYIGNLALLSVWYLIEGIEEIDLHIHDVPWLIEGLICCDKSINSGFGSRDHTSHAIVVIFLEFLEIDS